MLRLLVVFVGTSCAVVDNDGINLLQVQAAAYQVNSLDVAGEQQPNPGPKIIATRCKQKRIGNTSQWEAAGKCCKVAAKKGGMRDCRLDTCWNGPAKNSFVEDCMKAVQNPINLEKIPKSTIVARHCKNNKLVKPNQWIAAGKCCKYGWGFGNTRNCRYDTCWNGPPKNTYVEGCMEMMQDKDISKMYVGRGKCVDRKGKLFSRTQSIKPKKGISRLECVGWFKLASAKNKAIRAAQWNANGGVCVLYKDAYSNQYVKTVDRDPDYASFDCFKPLR